MARKATARSHTAASWAQETAHAGARAGTRPGTRAGTRAQDGQRPPRRTTSGSETPANWWVSLPAPLRGLITGLVVTAGSALAGWALLAFRAPGHAPAGLLALLGGALVALLGWGAYPLVLGLLGGGLARSAEGLLRRPVMRRVLPLQGLALWLLVLGWSHLVRGGHTGGAVGTWTAGLLGLLPWRLAVVLAPVAALLLACAMLGITWAGAAAAFSRLGALSAEASLRRAGITLRPGAPPDAADDGDDEDDAGDDVAVAPQTARTSAAPGRAPSATPRPRPARPQRAEPAMPAMPSPIVPPMNGAQPAIASWEPHRGTASPTQPPFVVETDPAREWLLPPASLFEPAAAGTTLDEDRAIEALADRLDRTLRALRVDAEVRREDITVGPMVVRLGIRPLERRQRDAAGRVELDADGEPVLVRTRVSRILALQPDLALALQVPSLRMEAPVPGQPYVGVEVPNPGARPVGLREVVWSEAGQRLSRQHGLMVALGRDVTGHARVGDLATFPHALVAGATGSGKSVCLHSLICSLLATHTPADLRLLLIDPKLVELSIYEGVPHLLLPVITEVEGALDALERAIAEMRRRFALFSRTGVRNLESYRRLRERKPELEPLAALVIVVDEVANLMLAGDGQAEELLCTLAQLARAAGIHLVIATQRPSVDVITGTIKANFPTRLAFAMASAADSRTILDAGGAEHLLGRGDMLFVSGERARPERIQGCRVLDEEIERLVAHWAEQSQRSQPTRPRQRNLYEEDAWPSAGRRSTRRAGLDGDATIEARQAGGRTRWGWPATTDRTDDDEWTSGGR